MKENIDKAKAYDKEALEKALAWKDEVLVVLNKVRSVSDILETKVESKYWPIPTYTDLLFGIE